MRLVFTTYLDRSPGHVRHHLAASIPGALLAAGDRVHQPVATATSSLDADRAVIHGGFAMLDGASIDWDGLDDLTTMRVSVERATTPSEIGRQVLAANRFAEVLTTSVRSAA